MGPLAVHSHSKLIKAHSQLRERRENMQISCAEGGSDLTFYTKLKPLMYSSEAGPSTCLFLAECESCDQYLAEFQCSAVLSFHHPAIIFGMSYQMPVKCIIYPCVECSKKYVKLLN